MHALLNPVNPAKKGIKWPLVIHTTAMFLFITIYTGTTLYIHSNSYIDDREFPSTFLLPRGPIGYQFLIYSDAVSIVPFIMFILNNWLADGLLVRSPSDPTVQLSNMNRSRYIAAMLSIP